MGAYLNGHGDVAMGEYLNELVFLHKACCLEIVKGNLSALGEKSCQVGNVDNGVFLTSRVSESLKFRKTHVDRHLATLECR